MQAPPFTLREYHTDTYKSLSDYKGQAVMVTFWASWCPDSIRDLAQKAQFYQSMQTDKLAFLTINVTGREGHDEDGATFIKEHNYTFPVLFDEGTKVYDRYRCMGVPTTVLINEQQEIVATYNDRAAFIDIIKGVGKLIE
ncbi:TlpA disulfide reductase family protein [Desertibacillus haloalkaliphilus]|uniref:TlpA disulfide reductase family protein n=1 Tax=Desertibacillus haloalkaliphilus TaxID=1328930 RepID=UPI001C26B436|nr:TlpA disulfide reductase family protein [Desertibacillus haloalkaliphilus]MBU8907314.1 TlpA family protein disulfide reductase [Desertibacillus haloalkaliphilus]